jgi:hypothetical protein
MRYLLLSSFSSLPFHLLYCRFRGRHNIFGLEVLLPASSVGRTREPPPGPRQGLPRLLPTHPRKTEHMQKGGCEQINTRSTSGFGAKRPGSGPRRDFGPRGLAHDLVFKPLFAVFRTIHFKGRKLLTNKPLLIVFSKRGNT